MADPATAKVTLATLIGATAVGAAAELLVEWVGLLLGASVGGLIACSLAQDLKDAATLQRVRYWGLSALVGGIAAPVAMMAAARVLGPLDASASISVLPFVSMLAAGYWRHVAKDIPTLWDRWRDKS